MQMAIRFASFEQYKIMLGAVTDDGTVNTGRVFVSGLMAGTTEAMLIVTPAEAVKVRIQSQYHSMMDPLALKDPKYKNAPQTALTILREEGPRALWRGAIPTVIRQSSNQGINFTGEWGI